MNTKGKKIDTNLNDYGLQYAEKLYLHDPVFHHLVDAIFKIITTAQLTPAEVRQAASFAALRVEQRRIYFAFKTPELEKEGE